METTEKTRITVQTTVNAPIEKAWQYWVSPEHIVKWNQASEDWHTPWAKNDVKPGGKFLFRMESKDGIMGFDFGGEYNEVKEHKTISYTMGDDRRVEVNFDTDGNTTTIVETFEAENSHSIEMQKQGWQSIMDNYKRYVEEN
jgi:uncharacterized protein YndB with AHSA1/START domain